MASLNLYKIIFIDRVMNNAHDWIYIFAETEDEARGKLGDYYKNQSGIDIDPSKIIMVKLIAEAGEIII